MDARAALQQSIGIETKGGAFEPLIDRGSRLPVSASFVFSTADDHQPSVKVKVFRGEDRSVSRNAAIGRFEISGFTPGAPGLPQIEVTFHVDEYEELAISAMDLAGRRELSVSRID